MQLGESGLMAIHPIESVESLLCASSRDLDVSIKCWARRGTTWSFAQRKLPRILGSRDERNSSSRVFCSALTAELFPIEKPAAQGQYVAIG